MIKQRLTIMILTLAFCILLASCTGPQSPAVETAETLTPTLPPTTTITPSPQPTATPTPLPIKIEDAIAAGTFLETDTIGKGRILISTFSPDGKSYVAVTLRGIYIYDAKTWEQLTLISLDAGERVRSVIFSPDGSLFAAGNDIGNVTLWHTDSWEAASSLNAYDGPITSLDISPDNQTFVTIGDEKVISLWNFSDGSLIQSQVRTKSAGPINYSVDGSFIMVSEATESGDVTTWSSTDLQFLDRVRYLGRKAPEHAVSPYKDVVASFRFKDLTVYDFDTKTEMKFDDIFGFFDEITNIIFIDENNLVIRAESTVIYLIDLNTSSIKQISDFDLEKITSKNPEIGLVTQADNIQSLRFEPYEGVNGVTLDEKFLVLDNGVLDLDKKEWVNRTNLADLPWPESAMLADGSIAIISRGQPKFPLRVTQSQLVITLLNPDDLSVYSETKIDYDLIDGIQSAALSPDGKILATGLYNGQMIFWDVSSKEQISTFWAHTAGSVFGYSTAINEVVFSNDSSKIATYGSDQFVKVWNVEDSSMLFSARGSQPDFSPDGKNVVYEENRGPSSFHLFVKILEDNSSPLEIYSGEEQVTGKIFTPDNNYLLFGTTYSSVLNIWSAKDNDVVAQLPVYTRSYSMKFNPLGTKLYMVFYDGVIGVWANKPD